MSTIPGRSTPILTVSNIMKQYRENGVVACREISFTARPGEIIAVLGENGSGKSTLMKVISGFLPPDRGEIRLGDRAINFHSPSDALREGIGMVQQQVQLIPAFSVLENLVLGNEPTRFPGRTDFRRARKILQALAERYSIDLDMDISAGKLNGVGRQNMSLLYLLSRDARIIILDEPGTVFDDEEHEYLYRIIRRLTSEGRIIIFVSHKIPEALHLADHILVLREGELIAQLSPRDTDTRELSRLIMGGPGEGEGENANKRDKIEVSEEAREAEKAKEHRGSGKPGKAIRFDQVSCSCPGYPPVKEITFTANASQVHAVLGMKESGLRTLEMILSGETRPDRGTIYLGDEKLASLDPMVLRERGVGYIPSQRIERGTSIHSTVEENLILLDHRNRKSGGIKPFPREQYDRYGIRGGLEDPLSSLSGGNIQKVIIARELEANPKTLILAEPSKGLDPQARLKLGEYIEETKKGGATILLLTSEMDDALDFGDRISILHGGLLSPPMARSELDREKAGIIMLQGTEKAMGKEELDL